MKYTMLFTDGTDDILAHVPHYAYHYVPFLVAILLRPDTDLDLLVQTVSKLTVPVIIATRDMPTLSERVLSIVHATPEITYSVLIGDTTDWIPLLVALKKEDSPIHLIASKTTDLFLYADSIGTRSEKDKTR